MSQNSTRVRGPRTVPEWWNPDVVPESDVFVPPSHSRSLPKRTPHICDRLSLRPYEMRPAEGCLAWIILPAQQASKQQPALPPPLASCLARRYLLRLPIPWLPPAFDALAATTPGPPRPECDLTAVTWPVVRFFGLSKCPLPCQQSRAEQAEQ